MFRNARMQRTSYPLFTKKKLLNLKFKAIRFGVWFRALSKLDRALVNLTVKIADEVRSRTLTRNLFSVVQKLECAFKNKMFHILETVGFPFARKLSLLAQKWNNPLARDWMNDVSFAKFLAIIYLNTPEAFKHCWGDIA